MHPPPIEYGFGSKQRRADFERLRRWIERFVPDDWPQISGLAPPPGTLLQEAEPGKNLFRPTPLIFAPTDPTVFWEHEDGIPFRGQETAKELLQLKIDTVPPLGRVKALLVGSAGTGKTSLAWIVAKKLAERRGGRFFEILSTQIAKLEDFADFVVGLEDYDNVFVDEVHLIPETIGVEPLLHILADTGYPRLKVGRAEIEVPPNVSWLAATTDPGRMDKTTGGALRRRFDPIIRLEPPSVDTLAEILTDQPFPITRDAAYDIAERSNGLPWQALSLSRDARDIAMRAYETEITLEHAMQAFRLRKLDENGLGPDDRAVIWALLQSPVTLANGTVRYKMAQSGLCASSGVDPETFRSQVQPKLLQSGLLTTVGGQVLTERALQEYGHLQSLRPGEL